LRETQADAELLVSWIPVIGAEVYAPLRAAGYSDEEIRDLGGLEGLA
jgi:alkylhydroperoxidase family enzyme